MPHASRTAVGFPVIGACVEDQAVSSQRLEHFQVKWVRFTV
jgi:hypothetical protein